MVADAPPGYRINNALAGILMRKLGNVMAVRLLVNVMMCSVIPPHRRIKKAGQVSPTGPLRFIWLTRRRPAPGFRWQQ